MSRKKVLKVKVLKDLDTEEEKDPFAFAAGGAKDKDESLRIDEYVLYVLRFKP